MTDPRQPLTVMQARDDAEWRRLIARFNQRRCEQCRAPLPTDAPSGKRYCASACVKQASRARMMTALRRADERSAA